jgi:3-oxoacyl-[acyl-carrier-protein] synthase III
MPHSLNELTDHLLFRLAQVQRDLGMDRAGPVDATACFADVLDSMGLVEYLAILAQDWGIEPAMIEEATGRKLGTVAELARSVYAARLVPDSSRGALRTATATDAVRPASQRMEDRLPATGACWLTATAVRLPDTFQPAAAIDELLHRPIGWLECHAGLRGRRIWNGHDALAAAAQAGRDCLTQVELAAQDVGALLVASEASPLLVGLAAALHHRLELRPDAAAFEVGGACTGFLAALRVGQALLAQTGPVLVLALEAPSRYLSVQPGPAGEAAALFGDAAAASLLCDRPLGSNPVPVAEVVLGAQGDAGHLLRAEQVPSGTITVRMDGRALASRAIRVMATAVRLLVQRHGLDLAQVRGLVAHGGNGRMPVVLARQLGWPPERVWSETAATGNLGSASLPMAWNAHRHEPPGVVAWATVGAGLTWAAALTGLSWS